MPRGQGYDTPMRNGFRVDDAVWEAFNDAVQRQGVKRSRVLVEFMAWFARMPGAKLPKRPPAQTEE